MVRSLSLTLFLGLWIGITAAAQAQGEGKADAGNAAEQLKKSPNDPQLFNAYMSESAKGVFALMNTDPAAAEKKVAEMETLLKSLDPTEPQAQQLRDRGLSALRFYRDEIDLAKTSLEDLVKQVTTSPDDLIQLNKYFRKAANEVAGLTRTDPDKATEKLKAMKDVFATVKEKSKVPNARGQVERFEQNLGNLEKQIEAGRKLLALVGKDAAPMNIETWINGKAISNDDLKGKVVLLDFWAVWCGPCIATFPHLREWNEKYADKGLVMIGLTNYYNYSWDEAANQAKRSDGEVPHDQEHVMLEKFAKQHNLSHRFGVTKDRSLASYYGVSGIPHVVVIDQAGKIRMVRVGSGEKNAKDIGDLLEQLLAAK